MAGGVIEEMRRELRELREIVDTLAIALGVETNGIRHTMRRYDGQSRYTFPVIVARAITRWPCGCTLDPSTGEAHVCGEGS